jgi:4-amino-4-deoxy-L-arabinose transferase-like glycosyltransferase
MKRREWYLVGLILLVALALRLVLWWILPRANLVSDEPEYMAAASWLAQGRGFSFYDEWPWMRPPLYVAFLGSFLHLFGFNLAPIRLVQIVISLAVPVLVYLLARTMLGKEVAFWAGLISAIWLPLAVLPHLILAENLFLPLLLAAVWCLVKFQQEGRLGWLLISGGCWGLATLTKGLTVGFLPLAGLWIGWQSFAKKNHHPKPAQSLWGKRALRALVHSALLLGMALLLILPWTGYNWQRYGRPILVDTTGGYNFWLGTEGGQFQNSHEVHQTLLDLPDPAARQTYAYQQGLTSIAEDTGGFLASRFTEIGQLLRINYSADERLVDGFVLGAVSIPHLLAVFFLEDTLYVVLITLALYGLFLQRREAGRGLVLLWLGFNLFVAVAFFAISRFRLPLLPFIAIYAAVVLAKMPWAQLFPKEAVPREDDLIYHTGWPLVRRMIAAGLFVIAFWIVVLPSYLGTYPSSSGATWLGIRGRRAATHLERAETALLAGDLAAAEEALQPALQYRPNKTDPAITALVVQAEIWRAQGNDEKALGILNGSTWYQAYVLRGDIFRSWGDLERARAQFGVRTVDQRNPTSWAWDHLRPPASTDLDLGSDLDLGMMDGFYLGEEDGAVTFRWSQEEARLRFPGAGTGRPMQLSLHLRAWRPAHEEPAVVRIIQDEAEIGRLQPSTSWEEVHLSLPASPAGEDIVVTLRTNTFLAGPRDLLLTGELRFLGVMVDRGRVGE